MREAYDALLELEAYGVKIRDVDDQFTNADFRMKKQNCCMRMIMI